MKRILLFVSFLFALLLPMERWGQVHAAFVSVEIQLQQSAASLDHQEDRETAGEENHQQSLEEICTTAANGPAAVIAATAAHPLTAQQRHLATRSHLRLFSHLLLVRNALKMLSQHLTTLAQQISRTYTTLKIPCWQYSVDNYVYAYRHIVR